MNTECSMKLEYLSLLLKSKRREKEEVSIAMIRKKGPRSPALRSREG